MPSFTQTYYHIVFSTKRREHTLTEERKKDLFRYIWGILKNKKCHLYRINGVEDHVHILTSLHPTVDLSSLMRDLKTSTSAWIKRQGIFPEFTQWQDKYGAFTESHTTKDRVIEYIKSQEAHHQTVPFIEELKALLREAGLEMDERYLE